VVQLVECLLAKEKVVGSSPIARSVQEQMAACMWLQASHLRQPFFISGDVAKWQGKGLQNPDHGFKSHRRLFLINQWGNRSWVYRWAVLRKSHRRLFLLINEGTDHGFTVGGTSQIPSSPLFINQ